MTGNTSTFRAILASLIVVVGLAAPLAAQEAKVAPEYNVKAAYLRVFSRYVEWPAGTHPSDESPITIGILGTDPFGTVIDQTMEGQASQSRPLSVRRIRTADEALGCHIVFISRDAGARQSEWLSELRHRPVLTVVETRSAPSVEGVVTFVTETVRGEQKVRFNIDLAAARSAGLKIASPMLVAAREVRNTEAPKGASE